jgi:PqqD family protein of HPr-rel-A system
VEHAAADGHVYGFDFPAQSLTKDVVSPLWAAPAATDFELRKFSDEAVLFDPRDGSTHYLSAVGAAILQMLTTTDCDTDELMARLESHFQVVLADVERRQIGVMLQQLCALGLVTCRSD